MQYLNLNVHFYLDSFVHGSSSSFENHWLYQQCLRAIGSKICIFHLLSLLKARMTVNVTE